MFECAANGSESMTISWTKNGEPILYSHFYISDGTKRSFLEVSKATVDASGTYQCIATNADNETIVSEPAELLSKTAKMMHNNYVIMHFLMYSSTINEHTS